MRFIKENVKLLVVLLIGMLISGGIVYAAVSANQVSYSSDKNTEIKTVADALNDLYKNRGVNKNSQVDEIASYSISTGARNNITISNVNNYKYYFVQYIIMKYGDYNHSTALSSYGNPTSSNSQLLNMGCVYWYDNNIGTISKTYLIFPDASGENIILSATTTDSVAIYGIK